MAIVTLDLHPGLAGGSRLPPLARHGQHASALEWACMLGLGLLGAMAAIFLRLQLGIPGHAILRTVLPVATGLALVPRHMAGSVISTTAVLAALGFQAAGVRAVDAPAMTSLLLTGPLLDLALLGVKPGWWLYVRMAVAGLLSNLSALASKIVLVLLGIHIAGGRAEQLGWVTAASYTACGLAAGLISAVCWFRLNSGRADQTA
jgi:hypothetical protein